MNSAAILVVEDEGIIAKGLQRRLERLGYAVVGIASTGQEAVEKADRLNPELVLMDIQLGDGPDGIEAAEVIRARQNLPVVFLTSHSDPATLRRAKLSGPFGYVLKPYEDKDLTTAIEIGLYRHGVERQLAAQNEQLGELLALKNRFLGMAAHDMRNPLGVVLGYGQMLLEDLQRPSQLDRERCLRSIIRGANSVLTLVDEIVALVTLEAGELRLSLEESNLEELVSQAVEYNSLLARPKRIHITTELEDLPSMRIDQGKIEQVLNNLVGNAVKFSGPDTTVVVRVKEEGSHACVVVSDQGPGIPEHEQALVFQPFQRSSVRATGGESSTGLGLAIAKLIVESHGGELTLRSKVGTGSTFSMRLPKKFNATVTLP